MQQAVGRIVQKRTNTANCIMQSGCGVKWEQHQDPEGRWAGTTEATDVSVHNSICGLLCRAGRRMLEEMVDERRGRRTTLRVALWTEVAAVECVDSKCDQGHEGPQEKKVPVQNVSSFHCYCVKPWSGVAAGWPLEKAKSNLGGVLFCFLFFKPFIKSTVNTRSCITSQSALKSL